MEPLPTIKFSSNYNGKLNCKAFPTVRTRNDKKYITGNDYTIVLDGNPIYTATIISITHFELKGLTPAMSYLDTGYSPKEQIEMMKKMYSKYVADVFKVTWSFIVLTHKLLGE
jgi:hypothetical protein